MFLIKIFKNLFLDVVSNPISGEAGPSGTSPLSNVEVPMLNITKDAGFMSVLQDLNEDEPMMLAPDKEQAGYKIFRKPSKEELKVLPDLLIHVRQFK